MQHVYSGRGVTPTAGTFMGCCSCCSQTQCPPTRKAPRQALANPMLRDSRMPTLQVYCTSHKQLPPTTNPDLLIKRG
jgi:hypothetical protein